MRYGNAQPQVSPASTVNDLMWALLMELAADDVPAPLAQPLALGALWADLARIAGE